jgi:aldehyde dehydrogenase
MQYASQNLIPVTLELGGKSPNIFFEDVRARMTISSTRRSRAS